MYSAVACRVPYISKLHENTYSIIFQWIITSTLLEAITQTICMFCWARNYVATTNYTPEVLCLGPLSSVSPFIRFYSNSMPYPFRMVNLYNDYDGLLQWKLQPNQPNPKIYNIVGIYLIPCSLHLHIPLVPLKIKFI